MYDLILSHLQNWNRCYSAKCEEILVPERLVMVANIQPSKSCIIKISFIFIEWAWLLSNEMYADSFS